MLGNFQGLPFPEVKKNSDLFTGKIILSDDAGFIDTEYLYPWHKTGELKWFL